LYQSPLSTYSLKVRLALAVKGVAPALREPPGGSYRSEAYRALVPPATVPALVEGDLVLTESDAIIEYVDERFPGPGLLPPGAEGRARARMLSRIVDMRLEASLRGLFPQVKDGRPMTAADLAVAERAAALACTVADPVGPWGCGAEPTLPDFGLVAAMVWLDLFRARGEGGEDAPRLAAWRAAWEGDRRFAPLLSDYRAVAAGWVSGFRVRSGG
jgi:glutathione S-transferase